MMSNNFPLVALLASVAIAVPSIYWNRGDGLAFASGLTTAAGTAYQYQRKANEDE